MAAEPPTVSGVLKQLFPQPRDEKELPYLGWGRRVRVGSSSLGNYEMLPLLPFDVFAVTAHLLEISGAYHHISPVVEMHARSSGAVAKSNHPVRRRLVVSDKSIRRARKLAAEWRAPIADEHEFPVVDKMTQKEKNTARSKMDLAGAARYQQLSELTKFWNLLFGRFGNSPVFKELEPTDAPPRWWALAHFLMMVSDEASLNVGFTPIEDFLDLSSKALWLERSAIINAWSKEIAASKKSERDVELDEEPNDELVKLPRLMTYSCADPDVACVLPKARTSAVGCTLRSLSHHIALLPPRGVARGRWVPPRPGKPKVGDELNLLLVPFPYSITDRAFAPAAVGVGIGKNWGFFDVHQTWLNQDPDPMHLETQVDRLSAFVTELALLAECKHGAREIDGIIFPELALTHDIYDRLIDRLRARFPRLELLISGISSDDQKRPGNFVAVSLFDQISPSKPENTEINIGNSVKADDDDDDDFDDVGDRETTIREKHHRWKLDRAQIEAYGLSGGLNPKFEWWEDISLLSRRVDFTAFRDRSVIAAMLCEDLARVDPCQELIRSVGPSIVVALLMDAPQLRTRWPARYATVLAEDPGTAVLTLTSRALMTRQHLLGKHKSVSSDDRVIAIWRDDYSETPTQIACPIDHQAVWLKLWSSPTTDYSLDGRDDPHGRSWQFGKYIPLKIEDAHGKYADILGDQDALAAKTAATDANKKPA